MAKFIFITGGVVSGLGKGITAASVGCLLKARGYKVAMQKMDPYFNVDSGRMSPLQHGEIFVTDDGSETDLSIGHYERFVDQSMTELSSVSTGKVYWKVLEGERKGVYDGGTVQVIPHITNEIKSRIYAAAEGADILITEIGGTVGDIESQPFIEAIRQISVENGLRDTAFIHVTLVPYIASSGELKSKPTQHSVKELLGIGVQPHILVCRTPEPLSDDMRRKIALFCNTRPQDVIENITADTPYAVPLLLEQQGLGDSICHHLRIENRTPELSGWTAMVDRIRTPEKSAVIGIVGRYVRLKDAYRSMSEALAHSGARNRIKVDLRLIGTDEICEKSAAGALAGLDGVVVTGGFGEEGFDEYIEVCRYARTSDLPILAVGLGFQAAVVEIARDLVGMTDAGSSEFGECEAVVDCLIDKKTGKSPFVRKGLYPCKIADGSRAARLYGDDIVYERHRSAYEVDAGYQRAFEDAGVSFSMVSPDNYLLEAIEIPKHRWFTATQFYPQFISRPNRAHPLITDFVAEAAK